MAKERKKLDELFHDTLKDIYFAEKKILATLPKMAKAAESEELRAAFEKHQLKPRARSSGLNRCSRRSTRSLRARPVPPSSALPTKAPKSCRTTRAHPALDAGLLAAAQAVEHYEIARYGTLIAWAEELGLEDAVSLLEETLEEEKATDEALTEIAKRAINQQAEAA